MTKRRKTVEWWIADIFKSDKLIKRAEQKDRKIDKSIGAQKKRATDKTPETDWRRLIANETPEK